MTGQLSQDITYATLRAVRWSHDLEQYSVSFTRDFGVSTFISLQQEFEKEVHRLHSLDKEVINNRYTLEHLQVCKL
jgi:hypothetical protein